jgi:glucose/arabinose dehydrogenase
MAAASRPAAAQTAVPTDFADQLVVGSFNIPVALAFLPDGRLFVIEQATARIRLIVNGALAAVDPVVTVDSVRTAYGEQGLLGIAVDPGWPARPYVYVQYDYIGAPVIRISRFTVGGDLAFGGDGSLTIDPASRHDVMSDLPDQTVIHNGGTLRFGPDGMLYSSLGDDGASCDAQHLAALRGKILRLDVSGLPPGPGGPPDKSLITPADNPFAAHPDPRARLVWQYGLRNPARFHVDPATGDLFIADVGTIYWEEISWAPAPGMNFGWPHYEGPLRTPMTCAGADSTLFVAPIYAYDRCDGGCELGASVISGGLYRRPPSASHAFPPEYDGDYFFTDYYRRFLRRLKRSGNTWSLAPPVPGQSSPTDWGFMFGLVTDFAEGPDGALYYCQQYMPYPAPGSGQVRRIVYTGTTSVAAPGWGGVEFAPAYPSPTRGAVTLTYRVPAASSAALRIYDVVGRPVRVLVAPGIHGPGSFEVRWDARDAQRRRVPAGVYLARLTVDGTDFVRRVVLLP